MLTQWVTDHAQCRLIPSSSGKYGKAILSVQFAERAKQLFDLYRQAGGKPWSRVHTADLDVRLRIACRSLKDGLIHNELTFPRKLSTPTSLIERKGVETSSKSRRQMR